MPRIYVRSWPFIRPLTAAPVQFQPAFWAELSSVVEVVVTSTGFPPGHRLEKPRTLSLPLRDLMLASGIASSSATSVGDFSAWGFMVEHAQSFRASAGKLRTVEAADHWDSRTKGLLSERVGMGLTAWLLWHEQDVTHIADAEWFIGRSLADPGNPYHGKGLKSLGLYGEDGGYKPDFFCLDSASTAVIAESKGALGPPSAVSAKERRKAKEQVKNVDPTGVALRGSLARLAFAATIRGERDRPQTGKDSQVSVEDPDGADAAIPVHFSRDELVVHSYCKFLQFCGLGWLGLLLRTDRLAGVSLDEDADVRQVAGQDVVVLANLGGGELGLLRKVFDALFDAPLDGVAERISGALRQADESSQHDERSDDQTEADDDAVEPQEPGDDAPGPDQTVLLPNGITALWQG